MRRAIEIVGTDLVLELSKYTIINNDGFKGIHIDQLEDGTYRLLIGNSLIDDFSKVESLRIVRED